MKERLSFFKILFKRQRLGCLTIFQKAIKGLSSLMFPRFKGTFSCFEKQFLNDFSTILGFFKCFRRAMRDFRQKKRGRLKTNRAVTSPACPGVISRPWLNQPIQGTWRL